MSEQGQGLVEQLPKVEQHIHLVVSVRTETLLWLVAENGIQSDDLADPDGVIEIVGVQFIEIPVK